MIGLYVVQIVTMAEIARTNVRNLSSVSRLLRPTGG
jgi:hypothetical protein